MWISCNNGQMYLDEDKIQGYETNDNGDGTFVVMAKCSDFNSMVDTGSVYESKQAALDAITAHIGSGNIAETF